MPPTIVRVDIDKDSMSGSYIVWPVWYNVDRPKSSGYSCGKNKKLAERLARSFERGVCYTNAIVKADIDGDTYVDFEMTVRMRQLNADLNRLGF